MEPHLRSFHRTVPDARSFEIGESFDIVQEQRRAQGFRQAQHHLLDAFAHLNLPDHLFDAQLGLTTPGSGQSLAALISFTFLQRRQTLRPRPRTPHVVETGIASNGEQPDTYGRFGAKRGPRLLGAQKRVLRQFIRHAGIPDEMEDEPSDVREMAPVCSGKVRCICHANPVE